MLSGKRHPSLASSCWAAKPRLCLGRLVALSIGFAPEMECGAHGQSNRVFVLLPGMTTATVAGFDGIDWTSVGWNGDTAPVPAVYIGTPRPSRKAVIHLLDPVSGTCQIIVKVPINHGARDGNSPRGRCLDEARCGAVYLRPTSACGRSQSRHFCSNGPSGSARFSPAYARIFAVAALSEVARQDDVHRRTRRDYYKTNYCGRPVLTAILQP